MLCSVYHKLYFDARHYKYVFSIDFGSITANLSKLLRLMRFPEHSAIKLMCLVCTKTNIIPAADLNQ